MLIIERVIMLGAAPVFAGLPDHVLAKVAVVVKEVTMETDAVIIEEGSQESWMFILIDGEASVRVNGVAVANVGPGSMIGELAALDPDPRSATVIATEPVLLFRIDHDALLEVMVDQPELNQAIITMLVRRLRDTNATMASTP